MNLLERVINGEGSAHIQMDSVVPGSSQTLISINLHGETYTFISECAEVQQFFHKDEYNTYKISFTAREKDFR